MSATDGLIIFQLSMCLFLSCMVGIAIGWTWARWREHSEEANHDQV